MRCRWQLETRRLSTKTFDEAPIRDNWMQAVLHAVLRRSSEGHGVLGWLLVSWPLRAFVLVWSGCCGFCFSVSFPCGRRVPTASLQQGTTELKGDDPETDQLRKGADSELPGWQPKETASLLPQSRAVCSINATPSSRPEAVEWAPSVRAGPLTTSLRGLWVSGLLPPDTGGPNKRAATLEPSRRRRRRLGPRADNPKRQRPNCHFRPRGTLEPAWVFHQGEGPQRQQRVKGKGPKDPGVVAPLAVAGRRGNRFYTGWTDACVRLYVSFVALVSMRFWHSQLGTDQRQSSTSLFPRPTTTSRAQLM